jgi:predicted CopG family antitoxin
MSKIINISNDVYKELALLKGSDSYSIVIRKLLKKRSNKEEVMRQFGKGEIDEKRMKEVKRGWKKWSERYA